MTAGRLPTAVFSLTLLLFLILPLFDEMYLVEFPLIADLLFNIDVAPPQVVLISSNIPCPTTFSVLL